jgi:hypothetical protein
MQKLWQGDKGVEELLSVWNKTANRSSVVIGR